MDRRSFIQIAALSPLSSGHPPLDHACCCAPGMHAVCDSGGCFPYELKQGHVEIRRIT